MYRKKGLLKNTEWNKKFRLNDITLYNWDVKNLYKKQNKKLSKFANISLFYISFIFSLFSVLTLNDKIKIYDFRNLIDNLTLVKLIIFIICMTLSISIHELSHVLIAKSMGAYIVQVRLAIITFFPCINTRICGIRRINNKINKIKISLAGISCNLLIFAINLWVFIYSNNFLRLFSETMVIVNLMIALFNLIIIFKTDGCHVLSILLEEDSLPINIKTIMMKKDSLVIKYCLLLNIIITITLYICIK